MKALRIHAGPLAREHIARNGLRPQDVRIVPGAAGGPKGLILGPIDRFLFGEWLPQSTQPIDLVGASIGAWRLANACLDDPRLAFEQFEHGYIHQHFDVPPGQKRMTAKQVSAQFGEGLRNFYGGRTREVLRHSRYRLHVITSRGRHILGREGRARTPVGYLGAFITNSVHRKSLGAWLERVVFSSAGRDAALCHARLSHAPGRADARPTSNSRCRPRARSPSCWRRCTTFPARRPAPTGTAASPTTTCT